MCVYVCVNHSTLSLSGLCLNLFTSSELFALSSKLQAGRVRKTAEATQQAFATAVTNKLHIVVTWDMKSATHGHIFDTLSTATSLEEEDQLRSVFRALLVLCSHIDIYQPWTKSICSEVAFNFWQAHKDQVELSHSYSQFEALSMLAAHMHLTAADMANKTLPHLVPDLVSPRSFMFFLKLSLEIAERLRKREMVIS